MMNPFKSITRKAKDQREKDYFKKIEKKALDIVLKQMKSELTQKDINELEDLYKEYYELYPNKENESKSKVRISKLRQMI
jgi:hypothetical protein